MQLNIKEDKVKTLITDVTISFLRQIILSQNFLKRLTDCYKITHEFEHESGFAIFVEVNNNKLIWGEVVGSLSTLYSFDINAINLSDSITPVFNRKNLLWWQAYPIVEFHLHTRIGSLRPSVEDLATQLDDRKTYLTIYDSQRIDCCPISIIGYSGQPNKLSLVLLQEIPTKFGRYRSKIFSEIVKEKIDDIPAHLIFDGQEICKVINKTNIFKAEYLNFEKPPNRRMFRPQHISSSIDRKLSKFTYQIYSIK